MSVDTGFDQLHIAHLLDVYATPELTATDDPVLVDCVAALAVIRNSFDAAARHVDADTARFLADCQQLAAEVETG